MRSLRIVSLVSPLLGLAAVGACSSHPGADPSTVDPSSPSDGNSAAPSPSTAPGTNASALTPKRWTPASELLVPAIKACSSIPEAFVDGEGRCQCPRSTTGDSQVFTTRGPTPKCAPVPRLPAKLAFCADADSPTPRLDTEADRNRWNYCLQELARLDDELGTTTFGLALPAHGTNPELSQRSIAWAKSRFGIPGSSSVVLWGQGLLEDSLRVHMGTPPARELGDAVRDLLAPVFTGSGLPWSLRAHAFASDPSKLDALLGEPVAEAGRVAELAPPPPPGDRARDVLFRAYTAAFQTGELDVTPVRGREFGLAGRGCASHCIIESATVNAGAGVSVRLERVYLSGGLAREVLWVDGGGKAVGAVVVGSAKLPLAYLSFDTQESRERMTLSIRAYDHLWALAGTQSYVAGTPYTERDAAARFDPSAARAPTIALCEGEGIELLRSPDLASRVLLGPHTSTGPGTPGSFLGWVPNPSGDPTKGLLGVVDRDLGAVHSRPGFYLSTGHAEAVARAALSVEPDARFVTLGTDACFSRFDAWSSALTTCNGAPCSAPAARVASISFASTGLMNACTTGFGALFSETEERILWVAAAGNGGEGFGRTGTEVPRSLCPALQGGSNPNLLVVAAATEAGLSPYSNFGASIVDVTADGGSSAGGESFEGTSFATPRVAAVSARLLTDSPTLSPSDVRTIIMAAARPVVTLRNVVRSGGLLDPAVTEAAAKCIAATGTPTTRTSLATCLREARYSGDIDDKLTLLSSRGVAL